jgi:hypothetical protein
MGSIAVVVPEVLLNVSNKSVYFNRRCRCQTVLLIWLCDMHRA